MTPSTANDVTRHVAQFSQKVYQVQMPAQPGQMAAVLYPRVHGRPAPEITPWANGAGARIILGGQTQYVVLADAPADVSADGITIKGRAAMACRKGAQTLLALLSGDTVGAGDAVLMRTGGGSVGALQATIDAAARTLRGESHGNAQTVRLRLPATLELTRLQVDGRRSALAFRDGAVEFALPAGEHVFAMR